jgi:hypothetical protein
MNARRCASRSFLRIDAIACCVLAFLLGCSYWCGFGSASHHIEAVGVLPIATRLTGWVAATASTEAQEVVTAVVPKPDHDGVWGANELLGEVEFRLATHDPRCSHWLAKHVHNPACGEAFETAMRAWIEDGSERAALLWAAALPASTGRSSAILLAVRILPSDLLSLAVQIMNRLDSDPLLAPARLQLSNRLQATAPHVLPQPSTAPPIQPAIHVRH